MPRSRRRIRVDERAGRHACLLPEERRRALPFLIDTTTMHIIAPWSRSRTQPGDEGRMDAMLESLDLASLPAAVCWCWPDRNPVPVENDDPSWLAHMARAGTIYPLE